MLSLSLKKRYRESYINRKLKKEITTDSPFVYFPLGVDMERNLLITAPFYTNQIEIIRHIVKSLPVGFKLFVKENPAQSSREWRPISEYKELMDIPNVTLIHPKIPSEKLLKNCSLVITISGSSGFEAAFHGKPSIILSDTVYSILPSVHRLRSPEELPEAIRKSLDKKVSSQDLARYIKLLEKNYVEFDWLGFGAKLNNKFKNNFYFEGGLVDVEIPIPKMKSFLEENKSSLEQLASEHAKKIQEYKTNIKPLTKNDV
jgi:hypothetical protein